jgi:hypothetical protein
MVCHTRYRRRCVQSGLRDGPDYTAKKDLTLEQMQEIT